MNDAICSSFNTVFMVAVTFAKIAFVLKYTFAKELLKIYVIFSKYQSTFMKLSMNGAICSSFNTVFMIAVTFATSALALKYNCSKETLKSMSFSHMY